jgi:dipeptidyl aminopeptidase/acylaminoacyl peptidase
MKKFSLSVLLASAAVSVGFAHAQAPAPTTPQASDTITATTTALKASAIPVEQWTRRPEFNSMSLSPNGDWLGAISPFKGRNNLVVINLAERSRRVLTSFETTDVANFYWVNNKRICMRVSDGQDVTGNFNYRGTFCINTDGSEFSDFTRLDRRGSADQGRAILFTPIRAVGGDSTDYIIQMPARTRSSNDLYRFNTLNGRYQLLTFNSPGDVSRWVLDRNQVPRVAVTNEPRQGNETFTRVGIWYRDSADGKWEKLWESRFTWGQPVGDHMSPAGFDFDNQTMFMASNVGRDKMALYRYDPKTKKLGELVYENGLVDIEGGLLFSQEKKKVVGIRYNAEMPTTKWFDPELDALQKQLDATLKGMVNNIGVVEEKTKRLLITSASPTHAGQYYLFDNETKSIEPLVSRRDWLPAQAMGERRFVRYKARDGMEIPAWLTLPKGTSGKNLPLVVHIHGGPAVRAYFGIQWANERTPYAHFLASRGYAVLEPEPRGSTGFGRKHYESSYKQWGLSMQDDLTDGALHLVKEGIVDKNRMCLFGGSYGGYASLQGVVREGDLFKCTIPYVAVTDLGLLQTVQHSDIAESGTNVLDTEFTVAVGDNKRDAEQFQRTSPARNVNKINVPVLLAMGSDDRRVPIIHGNDFVKAMRDAGRGGLIEYLVYNGEGHGFNKDANVNDFVKRMEQFLAKHIGDETQKKLAVASLQ